MFFQIRVPYFTSYEIYEDESKYYWLPEIEAFLGRSTFSGFS